MLGSAAPPSRISWRQRLEVLLFVGPALALMGVFLAWLFGYIDWSRAIMVLVAIVGVASAPVIAATIFA